MMARLDAKPKPGAAGFGGEERPEQLLAGSPPECRPPESMTLIFDGVAIELSRIQMFRGEACSALASQAFCTSANSTC